MSRKVGRVRAIAGTRKIEFEQQGRQCESERVYENERMKEMDRTLTKYGQVMCKILNGVRVITGTRKIECEQQGDMLVEGLR